MSNAGQLSARLNESAVLADHEVIFFGGVTPNGQQVPDLATGAAYNISSDSWRNISNAPEGRSFHKAVWTGNQMLIWGGASTFGATHFYSGVLVYDLTSDSWSSVNAAGEPAGRQQHSAVWTGTEMIVWGGSTTNSYHSDGGRFNPQTNTWSSMSTVNSPPTLYNHISVWTGSEMLIFGGQHRLDQFSTPSVYTLGKAYNPVTDTWRDFDISAFSARVNSIAAWDDNQLYLWGSQWPVQFQYGLIFNPGTGTLLDGIYKGSDLPTDNNDQFSAGVWTGSGWLLWGIHKPGPSMATQDGIIFSLPH